MQRLMQKRMQNRMRGGIGALLVCWLLCLTCLSSADTPYFSDTFTDAANTNLTAHTPNVGGSWVLNFNATVAPAAAVISSANRFRSGTPNLFYVILNGTQPGGTTYKQEWDTVPIGSLDQSNSAGGVTVTGSELGVVCNYSNAARTGYELYYNTVNSVRQFVFQKEAAGANTSLQTVSYTMVVGHTYHETLSTTPTGHVLTVSDNGAAATTLFTDTDTTYTASGGYTGVAGVFGEDDANGLHMDNYVASTPGGAGTNGNFSVTPSLVAAGQTITVTFTGVGTAWSNATVFTPNVGTLTNVVVTNATTASATWAVPAPTFPFPPTAATFGTSADGTSTSSINVFAGHVVGCGNSIMRGQGTSNTYANVGAVTSANTDGIGTLLSYLGAAWSGENYAVSGWTTTQVAADWTSNNRDSYINSAFGLNVLVAGEGTNETASRVIAAGASADTTAIAQASYNVMVSFCQARRAAGWKVIATTILPRDEPTIDSPVVLHTQVESARLKYNVLVRNNWRTWADALSDPALDSRIGPYGSQLNTALFYSNGAGDQQVHLADKGHIIEEAYTAQAVTTLYPAYVNSGGTTTILRPIGGGPVHKH